MDVIIFSKHILASISEMDIGEKRSVKITCSDSLVIRILDEDVNPENTSKKLKKSVKRISQQTFIILKHLLPQFVKRLLKQPTQHAIQYIDEDCMLTYIGGYDRLTIATLVVHGECVYIHPKKSVELKMVEVYRLLKNIDECHTFSLYSLLQNREELDSYTMTDSDSGKTVTYLRAKEEIKAGKIEPEFLKYIDLKLKLAKEVYTTIPEVLFH